MGTGYGEAVEGWIKLGEWWVDKWGSHLNKIANKVDSGSYTADDATTDLVDCAYLAAETTFLVGSKMVDTASVIGGRQNQPVIITSGPFRAEKAAASERRLALDGPLVSPLATNPIPTSLVTILPEPKPNTFTASHLPANTTAFRLQVTATGCEGVAYVGQVGVFKKTDNVRIDTLTVWVQVP